MQLLKTRNRIQIALVNNSYVQPVFELLQIKRGIIFFNVHALKPKLSHAPVVSCAFSQHEYTITEIPLFKTRCQG